jgi:hypothetical protein
VYVRPLPRGITDLKIRICIATQSTNQNTLGKTRDKLLYRLDVIRVTNGADTEHL